jgi:phage baseplate assembly protein W
VASSHLGQDQLGQDHLDQDHLDVVIDPTALIGPFSIASAEAFGTPQINLVAQPSSIASTESFGTPTIVLAVQPSSIASAESFGTPKANLAVQPTSIPSAEAFGTPKVNLVVQPSSIPSAEAFGTLHVGNLISGVGGIASSESFGTPTIVLALQPSSIASVEAFGTPTVLRPIRPTSIPSAEAFGAPLLRFLVRPTSIASAESFGTPLLGGNPLHVESVELTQRDTNRTWLADVVATVWHDAEPTLSYVLEYSIDGNAGPWATARAQPYDRRHQVGVGPFSLTSVPDSAPGTGYRYVWDLYQDLIAEDEGEFEVHFRLTIGGLSPVVFGPYAVSTETEVPITPLQRQLRKRAAFARVSRDFLGNGLVAPFARGSRDFQSASNEELVRACIHEILATRAAVADYPGELPWRPDFGSKLWFLKHRKRDESLEDQAGAYVREAFRWEPRARVTTVEIDEFDLAAPNELIVRVRYQIITQNVLENRVVLPEFEEVVSV